MNAEDVMIREVHTIAPGTLLADAARIMAEQDIGFLPVTEDGTLLGVLTDRDIIERAVATGGDPTQVTVGDIMSIEIVCCYPDISTGDIKRLMTERGFSRVPVIDEGNHLLGVVSLSAIDGGIVPRRRSVHVTFQKEKTDSYGHPHKVPLRTVYITGKATKEEAIEAAVKRFEAEQKAPWKQAADSIEVEDEPDAGKDKPV